MRTFHTQGGQYFYLNGDEICFFVTSTGAENANKVYENRMHLSQFEGLRRFIEDEIDIRDTADRMREANVPVTVSPPPPTKIAIPVSKPTASVTKPGRGRPKQK